MTLHNLRILSFILTVLTTVYSTIDARDDANAGISLLPVACQSLPYYVEVSNSSEPFVVRLHRCVGKDRIGGERHCVATGVEVVNITLYSTINGDDESYTLKPNHTECHEVCRLNSSVCNSDQTWDPNSCTCECNKNASKRCDEPFTWRQIHCGCQCPFTEETKKCDTGKVFSAEACGCVCHIDALRNCPKDKIFLDPITCLCTKDKPIVEVGAVGYSCKQTGVMSKSALIVVVVMEALVICGIIFTVKYLNKHPEYACWNRKERLHDSSDRYSIDTPTIDLNPSMSTNLKKTSTKNHKRTKSKKSRDQQHVIDISKRPFLGIGGDRKCRKYRYEMSNLVPISTCSVDGSSKISKTNDKLQLIGTRHVDQIQCNNDDDKNDDVITPTIRSVTEI